MEKSSPDAPIRPFRDFHEAAEAVLADLHRRVGMRLWMVTRVDGEDWIVLSAEDHGYEVHRGDVFRWSDSFCARMVGGGGPRVVPRSEEVPAYAEAPIGRQVPIAAYVGIPLAGADGSLFGTLCAIDPEPQPDSLCDHLPLVELHARLLSSILNAELEVQEQVRRRERAEAESQLDPLTNLYNRRGWERLRTAEEERCRRFGHRGGIIIVDLDDLKQVNDEEGHEAGDRLLVRASMALREAVRATDVVARLGGDEFGVLAVEVDSEGLAQLAFRVQEALAAADVSASLGCAGRHARRDFPAAQNLADRRMYRQKKGLSLAGPADAGTETPLAEPALLDNE